ncbi:uncharacterized protein LOC126896101 isoform X2 [Daktulosphaira vitifoliae]|uniref:uncharacterized protein LOC126896101 isoform X2 n=1 Tax=Daktulosphaira vitifoliae TaxID=58002 RepID=UPI0021AAE034|nr:uncharacterized protein LOC126896101 isoform X2 [Daktulosphaira vitifoliae]
MPSWNHYSKYHYNCLLINDVQSTKKLFFNNRIQPKSNEKNGATNTVCLVKYLASSLFYITSNNNFSALMLISVTFLVQKCAIASSGLPENLTTVFQQAKNTQTLKYSKATSLFARSGNSSHFQTKISHTCPDTPDKQTYYTKCNKASYHWSNATSILKYSEELRFEREKEIYQVRSRSSNKIDSDKIEAKLVATDDPCLEKVKKKSQLLYVKRGDIVDLKICFDAQLSKTFYVKYDLDGATMSQVGKPDERPTKFLVGENRNLFPDYVACFYTKNHQKALFEDFYKLPDRINTTSFMAKGHLASNGDFVSSEEKEGTFYFANITPQWQSINMKTWSQIESSVRRLSKKKNSTFTVYTGTHGQMTINNKPIYLTTNKRIPVPKWLWKVVIDKNTNESIGIVCTNDPFSDLKPICGSREFCDKTNWKYFGKTKSSGKGYCCTLEELKAAIPEANDIEEKSNGILRGPLLSLHAASMLKIQASKVHKKVAEKVAEKKKINNNTKNFKLMPVVEEEPPKSPRDLTKITRRVSTRKKKPVDSDPDYSDDST